MRNLFMAMLLGSILGMTSFTVSAAGGEGVQLFPVDINVFDTAALQQGARTFTDYCLGCHSASYMRFKRLAGDLGYTEEEVERYLLPAGQELTNTMTSSMSPELATKVFGTDAPDLSLVARARGEQWLYSYFLSFYKDEERALGWNNTVFPNASMPHVIWELQGVQTLAQHAETQADEHADGGHGGHFNPADQFELIETGLQDAEEYQRTVQDLVTFLVYLSEPSQLQRHQLGIWVILFLALFTVLAWFLKAEYWQDIH